MSSMNVAARYISLFMMAQSFAGLIVICESATGSLFDPLSDQGQSLDATFRHTSQTAGYLPVSVILHLVVSPIPVRYVL